MTPVEKQYKVFIEAQPYLCLGAVLETVLINREIYSLNQKDIGEYFSVHSPQNSDNEIKNIVFSNNIKDYGIKLGKEGLNPIFNKYNINLKETFISIMSMDLMDFENKIHFELENNSDIIFGYNFGYLFNEPHNQEVGHVSLITSFTNNMIQIFNPGPRKYGLIEFRSINLYDAIRNRVDGLWIITNR